MPVEVLSQGGQDFVPPTRTTPGRFRERFRDSLWIAWTFTLFVDWIAFFWIGSRAKNRRRLFWGFVYAVPFAALVALNDELSQSWPGELAGWAALMLRGRLHRPRDRRPACLHRPAAQDIAASVSARTFA